ncbi:MAG: hypothetical protein HPM95_12470 [Alphaproteobacteria bacterium]|nr:hypothetical protein [Alphaproteobacteria bacterium]
MPAEIADTASAEDAAPQPLRRKWGIAGGGLFGFASATRFLSGSGTQDRANADARIDAERAQAIADAAPGEAADAPTDERMDAEMDAPAADADEPEASAVDEGLSLDRFAPDESVREFPDQASDDTGETHATDDASADAADPDLHETAGETSADPDLDDAAGADGDTHADADADADAAAAGFAFEARERPVRFAWKMDIDRRFTFLSAEFGEALGPEAADVVGLTWDEVCERFGIDGDGRWRRRCSAATPGAGARSTGRSAARPLRVPVDMAALPAFDRNRIFEGFRGFGVCRTGDAKDDPEATGTQLHLRPSLDALTTADEAPGEEIGTQVTDLSDDAMPESGAQEIEETAIDAARADEIRTEADAPDDDLSESAFPVDPPGGETDDAGDEADISGEDGEEDHAALARTAPVMRTMKPPLLTTTGGCA